MKQGFFSLAALGAAVLVSSCVAYPAGGYHDYRDGAYRNGYSGSGYSGDRRDCRDERNCDRRDRDGDRRDRDDRHDDHRP